MKKVLMCLLVAGLMVTGAQAATVYLANSGDGSGSLDIPEGGIGSMDIRLDTSIIDPVQVAFLNAFLDSDDDNLCVDSIDHGQVAPFEYDQSSFDFDSCLFLGDADTDPGTKSNEYALIFGDQTAVTGGFPLGAATWVIDTLNILNTAGQSGTKTVTFELGARKPQAFGPGPTFIPFTTNDFCLPPGTIPGFLNMGEGNGSVGCFDGFEINKIPEPTTLALLALGGLAALRRRS